MRICQGKFFLRTKNLPHSCVGSVKQPPRLQIETISWLQLPIFDCQGSANFRRDASLNAFKLCAVRCVPQFLFYYRCSDIGIPFIRSESIVQHSKSLLYKDYMNIKLTTQNKMPTHDSCGKALAVKQFVGKPVRCGEVVALGGFPPL